MNTVAAGFLTVFPCGAQRPTASDVNYVARDVVPNLTITKLGAGGAICVYAHQPTDVIVDLAGWFPAT